MRVLHLGFLLSGFCLGFRVGFLFWRGGGVATARGISQECGDEERRGVLWMERSMSIQFEDVGCYVM